MSPDESRERVLAGTLRVRRPGGDRQDDGRRRRTRRRACHEPPIYRLFPGGRDELLRDTVAWEMARFFARLGAELGEAPDFETFLERALPFAREAVLAHAVLQKVLETEPERLMPLITVEQHRVLEYITAYFLPLLARDQAAGLIRPGVDLEMCAEYVAADGALADGVAGPPRPRGPRRGAPPGPGRAPRRRPAPMDGCGPGNTETRSGVLSHRMAVVEADPTVADPRSPDPDASMTRRAAAALLTCIARYGLAKTTLDDVAREAGCSRATLYRYFDGKHDLVQRTTAGELRRDHVARWSRPRRRRRRSPTRS